MLYFTLGSLIQLHFPAHHINISNIEHLSIIKQAAFIRAVLAFVTVVLLLCSPDWKGMFFCYCKVHENLESGGSFPAVCAVSL